MIMLSGFGLAVVPGSPTLYSVNPWDGQATVNFNPSVFDGGNQIQFYTVTATPGPITVSGSGSPITVNGLVNGQTYTFTVTATNGVGTGNSSNPIDGTPYYAPIRINNTTGYGDLAGAVTAAAAGDTIMLQQYGPAPLTLATPYTFTKGIKVYGGYSSDYNNPLFGTTIIPGRINIKPVSGQVSFRNIVVKAVTP
jgi:hypothetical protein